MARYVLGNEGSVTLTTTGSGSVPVAANVTLWGVTSTDPLDDWTEFGSATIKYEPWMDDGDVFFRVAYDDAQSAPPLPDGVTVTFVGTMCNGGDTVTGTLLVSGWRSTPFATNSREMAVIEYRAKVTGGLTVA